MGEELLAAAKNAVEAMDNIIIDRTHSESEAAEFRKAADSLRKAVRGARK